MPPSGSRDHAMRRLLSLSVCATIRPTSLPKSFMPPSIPLDASGRLFPINSSTFVWNVLSKDCTGHERHTRWFKVVKSDSRVLYRNNNTWVGCKDCSRSFSMLQLKLFDLVNTDLLIGPEKEGPRIG